VLAAVMITTVIQSARGEEIRLVDLVELSGTGADVGTSWRNGIDLAVEEINAAGGILGHKVVVEHYDTQSESSVARAMMMKALGEEPYAILGPIFSGSVKASMELSRQARVAQLVGAAAASITEVGDEYILRVAGNQKSAITALSSYLRQTLGISTVSIVWINNDFGRDGRNTLVEELRRRDVRVLEDVAVEPGQLSFDAEVARVGTAKAGGVVVLLNEEEGARFLRAARKQGLGGAIVGGASLLSAKVIELAGESANGAKGVLGLTASAPIKELQQFGRRFEARFRSVPDHNAIEGSIAVYAIKVATERMGGLHRDRLAATLHGLTITPSEEAGILVKTRWDDKGDPHRDEFIGEVVNGRQEVVQVIESM
jgi:branched-chain amino acid transport system substrate-binding protein